MESRDHAGNAVAEAEMTMADIVGILPEERGIESPLVGQSPELLDDSTGYCFFSDEAIPRQKELPPE